VIEIYKAFDEAGYTCQHFLLNASKMGVPQRRERVFFICLRKDLAPKFMELVDMFTELPKIELNFNEREIPFKEFEDKTDFNTLNHLAVSKLWDLCLPGNSFSTVHEKGSFFNGSKSDKDRALPTLTANPGGTRGVWHYNIKRPINNLEIKKAGSYPLDYNFLKIKPIYLIGMSVPPLMTGKIAEQIYKQWLSKLK